GQKRRHRDPPEPPGLRPRPAGRQDHTAKTSTRERLGSAGRTRGVVGRAYVPDAGDLVWLTFDPEAGHEQRGRRPARILSPRAYNSKTRLAIACPITSHVKGYPFEVLLGPGDKIAGVVLADHVKNL